MKAFSLTVAALALVACTTPAILDPHVPAGQCNPNTEHPCVNGGGCCLLNWACGGKQPDEPESCPSGYCCDDEPTTMDMGPPRRKTPMRRP